MQVVADAAAAYVFPKLLVPVEFQPVPAAGIEVLRAPRQAVCPECLSIEPVALIETTEHSMTQPDPAQFIKSECRGTLDAIVSALNGAGRFNRNVRAENA